MSAFDVLAPTYDEDFTESPIARWLRDQTQARLDRLFQAGDMVLELGCGTGEDARYLAQRGVNVLATDSSEAMLAAARAKAAGEPLMRVQALDIRSLNEEEKSFNAKTQRRKGTQRGNSSTAELTLAEQFDGVYANFGVLNCLGDWRGLAAWLAACVKPGGVVAFGVMAPFCVWEMLWHGLHGDLRTAFRRVRDHAEFQPAGSGERMTICYPTARRLERDFAPYFRQTALHPLGLFLPPSDVYGALEKRPRLLRTLMRLESTFGSAEALAMFGDHYWIEMKKRGI